MAARLATLGALGAEGTVPYMRKRWSVAINCGSVLFIVSVSLKDTETQQWVSSKCSLGCFFFSPSCLFLQILSKGGNKRKMFLWDALQVFLSNKQLKWDPEMNHRRASGENCVCDYPEFLSHTTMTVCEAVEPVRSLNESCLCSQRVGVAGF